MKLDLVTTKTANIMESPKKPLDWSEKMQGTQEDKIPITAHYISNRRSCNCCKWILGIFSACMLLIGIAIIFIIVSHENIVNRARFSASIMNESSIDVDVLLNTIAQKYHLTLEDMQKIFDKQNKHFSDKAISGTNDEKMPHDIKVENYERTTKFTDQHIANSDSYKTHSAEKPTLNEHEFADAGKNTVQQMKSKNDEKDTNIWQRYVRCEHFRTVVVNEKYINPSWTAVERCERYGVSSAEIVMGIKRSNHKNMKQVPKLKERFLHCEDAFDENLNMFTADLLHEYEQCVVAGALNKDKRSIIETKFHRIFDVVKVSTKEFHDVLTKHPNFNFTIKISNLLVNCEDLPDTFQSLCRNIGVTLGQIMLLEWQLVGEGWLIDQDMDRLFVSCNDLLSSTIPIFLPFDLLSTCLMNYAEDNSKRFIVTFT